MVTTHLRVHISVFKRQSGQFYGSEVHCPISNRFEPIPIRRSGTQKGTARFVPSPEQAQVRFSDRFTHFLIPLQRKKCGPQNRYFPIQLQPRVLHTLVCKSVAPDPCLYYFNRRRYRPSPHWSPHQSVKPTACRWTPLRTAGMGTCGEPLGGCEGRSLQASTVIPGFVVSIVCYQIVQGAALCVPRQISWCMYAASSGWKPWT